MSVVRDAPRTTVTTTFTCDRCKSVMVVVAEVPGEILGTDVPIPEVAIPDRWRAVLIGLPELPRAEQYVFCQRACMSTWFGEFVRRIYNEEKEGPARVARRRRNRGEAGVVLDGKHRQAAVADEDSILMVQTTSSAENPV